MSDLPAPPQLQGADWREGRGVKRVPRPPIELTPDPQASLHIMAGETRLLVDGRTCLVAAVQAVVAAGGVMFWDVEMVEIAG